MGGEIIRNAAEELKGATKEKLGDATNNESLQAEGAAEKADARAKQAAADIEDQVDEMNRP
ncbi:MAG: CsbD family protein [Aeromicrobium sp.]